MRDSAKCEFSFKRGLEVFLTCVHHFSGINAQTLWGWDVNGNVNIRGLQLKRPGLRDIHSECAHACVLTCGYKYAHIAHMVCVHAPMRI